MMIRVYWASVTSSRKIDGDQTRLRYIIESLNIPSEWIDITTDPLIRQKMREECGKPKAMPPQIFNEFRYLGEVEDMEEHIEQERIREWFGIDVDSDNNEEPSGQLFESTQELKSLPNNVAVSDCRSQTSPTSSVENEPPVPSSKTRPLQNGVASAPTDVCDGAPPPPARKNVLAAAGAFEALAKEPPIKNNAPSVVFTQSRSLGMNKSENKRPIDEERRRKILGLAATDNNSVNETQRSVTKLTLSST